MDPAPSQTDASLSVSVNLKLTVGSRGLQATLSAPSAPIRPQAMLPGLYALVDAIIGAAERELDGTGRSVSCRLGCAACCRQAVTISATEAYHIRDLVDAMPPSRQAVIKARFADVARRVKEAGLYAALMDPNGLSAAQREALALDYRALRIPCPFLEAETCSIYADRPLRCREYLVTSPPERCATAGIGDLEPVAVPRLSRVLQRLGLDEGEATAWPALSLALDWVEAHPDGMPLRTGQAWVGDLLGRIGKPPPDNRPAVAPPAEESGVATRDSAGDSIALPMPVGEVAAIDMLPTFRAYTEAIVARAVATSVANGKPPSCRIGCTACCYQLIPISTTEARRIAAVIDAMPEPRRTEIRARFDDADRRIIDWSRSAGSEQGLNNERRTEDDRLGSYFALGLACPLLEDDRCLMYDERPLTCREYLVTSPAENCAHLEEPGVRVEAVPRAFTALALDCLLSDETLPEPTQILLAHALRWVASHPEEVPQRCTANAWLDRFFARLQHVGELMHRDETAARGDTLENRPGRVRVERFVTRLRGLP